MNNRAERKAYIITGPTSGIGLATALEVAKHGDVVLVGRDIEKLNALEREIGRRGGHAIPVLCDISDITSVDRAALKIIHLNLHIAGLVNNAGINQGALATKSVKGWDLSFATNHLGPFVLTENLMPYMAEGASVVFIVSAVEDPEQKSARTIGFRGGRYISAEASAAGEWEPGGSSIPGADAYATSKQCALATAFECCPNTPRQTRGNYESNWVSVRPQKPMVSRQMRTELITLQEVISAGARVFDGRLQFGSPKTAPCSREEPSCG